MTPDIQEDFLVFKSGENPLERTFSICSKFPLILDEYQDITKNGDHEVIQKDTETVIH